MRKNTKKILMFSAYFLPHLGGIERYVYYLSKHLIKRGFDVTVVTCKYDDKLASYETVDKINIVRIPIFRLFASRYPLVKNSGDCKKIFQQLAARGFDYSIIHARFWTISMMGARWVNKYKIPTIVIDHGSAHLTVNNKILDFFGGIYEHTLTFFLKFQIKKYYGVSKASSQWLNHFGIQSSGILKNAIETEEYASTAGAIKKKTEIIKITYTGRLLKEKGLLLLVEAFNNLSQTYNNIELYIAGNGPLESELIKIRNNNPKIHLLGTLSHESIIKLLRDTSIFINPSFADAMPTSMLEAGMMGCALVGTKVGGIPEIIIDGNHGVLCETNENSIRTALKFYINNPEKIMEHGKNAHDYIMREYNWEKTVADTKLALEEAKK